MACCIFTGMNMQLCRCVVNTHLIVINITLIISQQLTLRLDYEPTKCNLYMSFSLTNLLATHNSTATAAKS